METNVCIQTGNVVRTPEAFATTGGQTKLAFTIAQNTRKRDESGQWVDGQAHFFSVVLWGKLAERMQPRLDKGVKVMVAGKLRTREYTAKDGGKRTAVEIVGDECEVIETPRRREYQPEPAQPAQAPGYQEYVAQAMKESNGLFDEDVPF